MSNPFFGRALPRRHVLRGLGVALSLPFLDAMVPALARAADAVASVPRRILAINNNIGLLPGGFFPDEPGPDYKPSRYLSLLAQHRADFTVMSGVSHPNVDGSHASEVCFLTAAPHPGSGGFRNSVSLDQLLAEQRGHLTRVPSLTLGVNVNKARGSLSWTGGGVLIPCQDRPSEIFKSLFVQGTPEETAQQVRKLTLGKSIMDVVATQAASLKRQVGARDRARLDQYTTGVRELERRLVFAREWEHRPKPPARGPLPTDPTDPSAYVEKIRLMYDMARVAFETDSTRLATLFIDSANTPVIDVPGADISEAYHNLSHHGKSEAKLKQLQSLDELHMKLLSELLTKLKSATEDNDTLLTRTMVLYGSNLGDANTHATTNMPLLLAGGGFKHGHHLAFDRGKNYPLPNLLLSMAHRFGVPLERFATSTGTMRGLEMA